MPAATRKGDLTTGHSCFPPTNIQTTPITSITINGKKAAAVGAKAKSHRCGKKSHPTKTRIVTAGSSTVFYEGIPAARIGDSVACGDTVGQGSSNVFVGG